MCYFFQKHIRQTENMSKCENKILSMASSFKRGKQLNNNTAFCGDLETFWSGINVENLRL